MPDGIVFIRKPKHITEYPKLTEEGKQIIIDYICKTILDCMASVYGPKFRFIRKELYNVVGHSCFCLQIYYDENTEKFYLYYDLDSNSRYYSPGLVKKINGKLLANFECDNSSVIEIVQPLSVLLTEKPTHDISAYQCSSCLRMNTFTYWRCFDGSYRFLEDRQVLMQDHNLYFKPGGYYESADKEQKLLNEIVKINNKYNFNVNNEENVKKSFDEYTKVYKKLFNRELKPINDEDITYIYLDAIYPDGIFDEL